MRRRLLEVIAAAFLSFLLAPAGKDLRAAGDAPVSWKSMIELQSAAEQGDAQAQADLGSAYMAGTGVSKNPAKAVQWYKKAAKKGNAMAQNNLGEAYWNGQGVSEDPVKAVEWWLKAAEQGNEAARINLVRAYSTGK